MNQSQKNRLSDQRYSAMMDFLTRLYAKEQDGSTMPYPDMNIWRQGHLERLIDTFILEARIAEVEDALRLAQGSDLRSVQVGLQMRLDQLRGTNGDSAVQPGEVREVKPATGPLTVRAPK